MKRESRKAFRKLKRLELVELIYQLRRENVAQERELARLREQLAESEALRREYAASQPTEETAARMETAVAEFKQAYAACSELAQECRALSAQFRRQAK